ARCPYTTLFRSLQATGAGGQELRGDRGDHGREPGYGEEPAAQGAHELRGTDRTAAELRAASARRSEAGPTHAAGLFSYRVVGESRRAGGPECRARSRLPSTCTSTCTCTGNGRGNESVAI